MLQRDIAQAGLQHAEGHLWYELNCVVLYLVLGDYLASASVGAYLGLAKMSSLSFTRRSPA